MPSQACRPTIRVAQGPYLVPDSLLRSDLREDQPGVPLTLTFTVLDQYFCTPTEGARVDIWCCDADGHYSGVLNDVIDSATQRLTGDQVDMRGTTHLRGHQISDADGQVSFTTIFPGWYAGRMTHLHARAILPDLEWTAFDTQFFFPPGIEVAVHATDAYKAKGPNPVGLDRDYEIHGDAATLAAQTLPLMMDADGVRGEAVLAISV